MKKGLFALALGTFTSVSYTHLNQLASELKQEVSKLPLDSSLDWEIGGMAEKDAETLPQVTSGAVSYTHLRTIRRSTNPIIGIHERVDVHTATTEIYTLSLHRRSSDLLCKTIVSEIRVQSYSYSRYPASFLAGI